MEPVNWMNVVSQSIATVDWTYAFSTLIIRFVGIFVVLGILQVIMQITGRIFAHFDKRHEIPPVVSVHRPDSLSPEQAAVVATALYLYDQD